MRPSWMAPAVAFVAMGTACSSGKSFRPLQTGDLAPAYSAATMKGDSVSLRALQGKAVLLNVWATWCDPCEKEMPAMEQLRAAFADSGLTILAVSIDDQGADPAVRRFIEDHAIHFTIGRDPAKKIQRVFHTIGTPETFLIDRTGKIAKRWIGQFDPGSEDTKAAVRQVIRG